METTGIIGVHTDYRVYIYIHIFFFRLTIFACEGWKHAKDAQRERHGLEQSV